MNTTIPEDSQKALDFLQKLAAEVFWGILSMKLENGKVVHIRKEQNYKPNELPGIDRRSTNEPIKRY